MARSLTHLKLIRTQTYYNKVRQRRKLRRRVRLNNKTKNLNEIKAKYSPNFPKRKYKGKTHLTVPTVINLDSNYNETVEFVTALREVIKNSNDRIILLFDFVQDMGPAGLLYLTAEIFRIRNLYPNRVSGTYPTDERIAALLDGMGFYKLLGINSNMERGEEELDKFHIMEFTSGKGNIGNQIFKLLTKIQEFSVIDDLQISRMYGAMDEAMNNVTDHAFKSGAEITQNNGSLIPMRDRWWLGGYVDGNTGQIFLMMHDQGAGIPSTLPLTFAERWGSIALTEHLKSFGIGKPKDSDYIKVAATTQQSGTGLNYRGRGFRRMRTLVDQVGSGELRVLSLKGEFVYKRHNETITERTIDRKNPIAGTLVIWRLDCAKAEEGKN